MTTKPSDLKLGEIIPQPTQFPAIETELQLLESEEFLALNQRKRFRKINQLLSDLIQKAPPSSFLLGAVLDYIERINQKNLLREPFQFSSFEFWLNNFSDLSDGENYQVRSKIVGKSIPRGDYQALFPIGMNHFYKGSHFVIAHLSPDVDTMVASFWGWLDAFGSRVGTGIHQWCLPGGPPDSPFTDLFQNMMGHNIFKRTARTQPLLVLTAMDLVNQINFLKKPIGTLTKDLGDDLNKKSVIIVNEEGHYLGDWCPADIELVNQVIVPFKACLRWYANALQTRLISLFAHADLSSIQFSAFVKTIIDNPFKKSEPTSEMTQKQLDVLDRFFKSILNCPHGIETTYRDLFKASKTLSLSKLGLFLKEMEKLSTIFDDKGLVKEDRFVLFNKLAEVIEALNQAIHELSVYFDRLEVILKIKNEVFDCPRVYVSLHADVEEMRQKMENRDFLTVVIQETDHSLFPVGIVYARDLERNNLGTVSFRDFSNFEEVKMSPYLELISVIDHHKTTIKTPSVPFLLISDVQSSNVLLAEQAFLINDRYSLGGMTTEQIEEQLKTMSNPITAVEIRIYQRLLKRLLAAKSGSDYTIHPQREYAEYLCFLQAILDDTDLLSKVSTRDLDCIIELLNRMKSISLQKEVEVITLDDIPHDKNYLKTAVSRLLQHPEMYSVYGYIYRQREKSVEENLERCVKGESCNLFVDTKEQNGCARVGQTKLFKNNFPYFLAHSADIQKEWLNQSKQVTKDHPEIDLFIHMISTISSAEEVMVDQLGPYDHQDELWVWSAQTPVGQTHLSTFLANFYQGVGKSLSKFSLELIGEPSHELVQLYSSLLPGIKVVINKKGSADAVAVLKYEAGKLNSRKTMISPFLPRLLT